MNYICLTEIKDAVLTIAAGVGIYVALRGLNTWNRQLKGGVEYELARRLLKCTYRLREAIKSVRNPVIWQNEQPSPPIEDAEKMSSKQRRYYGLSMTYQRRWDKVNEIRNDLQTELVEAEVLWGKEIHNLYEPLFKLQRELYFNIHSYLIVCDPDEDEGMKEAMHVIMKKNRDVMYDMSDSIPDEEKFTPDVSKAIASIEIYLMPHLKK